MTSVPSIRSTLKNPYHQVGSCIAFKKAFKAVSFGKHDVFHHSFIHLGDWIWVFSQKGKKLVANIKQTTTEQQRFLPNCEAICLQHRQINHQVYLRFHCCWENFFFPTWGASSGDIVLYELTADLLLLVYFSSVVTKKCRCRNCKQCVCVHQRELKFISWLLNCLVRVLVTILVTMA